MAVSATTELAGFAANLSPSAIPADVMARALALMIDLVGSIVRAGSDAESNSSILRTVERLGFAGEADCTVFGLDRRYGPAAAALLNGTLGHSLDFDDTHAESSLHPGATVVPAALAAAEITDASGCALLAAIVVGYEVCCRLGKALDPTAHYARGFHPSATAGVFGACAAAGRLLGLNQDQMVAGFGVATSQASGSLQFLENGAWNKRYQVGEAAMKGVLAATLASEGFRGAIDAIEGRHGFLAGYSDGANPLLVTRGLGQDWETLRVGVKPYPSCRYTHAAVDGLLQLRAEAGVSVESIGAITIGLHRNGLSLVGQPLAAKRRVRDIVAGQFSMPFAAAVALLRGRFGWDDYDLLGTGAADALCDRVTVVHDETLEGLAHPFGATLRVEAGGTVHRLRIGDPSGEPATFPDTATQAAKFHGLAWPVLGPQTDRLLEKIAAIPLAATLRGYFNGEVHPQSATHS